jgi:hypothetical protein
LTLLLTGCAVVETAPSDPVVATHSLVGAIPPHNTDFLPLRVGIEYLPPRLDDNLDLGESILGRTRGADRSAGDNVSVRALRPPNPARQRPASDNPANDDDDWILLSERELEAIEDPAERLTMGFIQDLFGEDRRRMQRELRTPILTNRNRYTTQESLRLPFDDLEHEEEASFLNEAASPLLKRPLRNLLKRATFINDFELALHEFKAENIPFSSAYRRDHPNKRHWGRLSLRLRMSDGSDPAELSYYNWGWRVGSSKERGRLQYRFNITDNIDGSVRFRYEYESHDSAIRADVRYIVDERTRVNLLLGDRLDFLAGPTAYSFLNSPLDGTPGVLFYVEHLF